MKITSMTPTTINHSYPTNANDFHLEMLRVAGYKSAQNPCCGMHLSVLSLAANRTSA
jgi:hypothetical protein